MYADYYLFSGWIVSYLTTLHKPQWLLSNNKRMIAFGKFKGIPEENVVAYSEARYVDNRSKGQILQ
jgi:hypothetical protein